MRHNQKYISQHFSHNEGNLNEPKAKGIQYNLIEMFAHILDNYLVSSPNIQIRNQKKKKNKDKRSANISLLNVHCVLIHTDVDAYKYNGTGHIANRKT